MSLFLYLNFLALDSRIPSMIDAWFNSSLNIASSGVIRASNKPAFASKQQAYRIVSSRSWNLDIFSSSSLWRSCTQNQSWSLYKNYGIKFNNAMRVKPIITVLKKAHNQLKTLIGIYKKSKPWVRGVQIGWESQTSCTLIYIPSPKPLTPVLSL